MRKFLIFSTAVGVFFVSLHFFFSPHTVRIDKSIVQHETQIVEPRKAGKSAAPASRAAAGPSEQTEHESRKIQRLIAQLNDEDFTKFKEAADALALLGGEAIPFLTEALRESPAGLRGQIVFILGRIQDSRAFPVLASLSNDENAYIRRNTIEALGRIKDARAAPFLIKALSDEDASARERAVRAIAAVEYREAVPELMNRLTKEEDERVKLALVDALAKLRDQRAAALLLTELKSKSSPFYKNKIVLALGGIGDASAAEGLREYIDELRQLNPAEDIVSLSVKESIRLAEDATKQVRRTY